LLLPGIQVFEGCPSNLFHAWMIANGAIIFVQPVRPLHSSSSAESASNVSRTLGTRF
jgi:hypothetical protein